MLLLIAFFHEIRELSFHKMSQHQVCKHEVLYIIQWEKVNQGNWLGSFFLWTEWKSLGKCHTTQVPAESDIN